MGFFDELFAIQEFARVDLLGQIQTFSINYQLLCHRMDGTHLTAA